MKRDAFAKIAPELTTAFGWLATFLALKGAPGLETEVLRDAAPAPISAEEAGLLKADFRHSPPWWQSSICLPDDWQKTLVSKEGALLYDYLGEYSGFGTRVSASVAGPEGLERRQRLADPRTPIVETLLLRGVKEPEEMAGWLCLAVAPGKDARLPMHEPGPSSRVAVEATTPATPLPGWGRPAAPCAEGFKNIVAGFGCDVGYRFRAAARGRYAVAFGFMESHHTGPGMRVVDVFIEGRKARRVDLIADIGKDKAAAYIFDAEDLDGDGFIQLAVRAAPESQDQYPILNMLWVFRQGAAPSAEALVRGDSRTRPLAEVDCGGSGERPQVPAGPPRGDLMLLWRSTAVGAFQITVESKDSLATEVDDRGVYRAGARFMSFSSAWTRADKSPRKIVLTFSDAVRELAVYCASGHDAGDFNLDWAKSQEGRSKSFWSKVDFPYGRIQVPDGSVQALLDSSIRNIYQAREMREGLPVFQVGPTCYRGLWVVDGAFLLEAMTFLGRGLEARSGIEHLLKQAKADGSFEIIKNYWKENGIVCYILYRHALLTQDEPWLAEHWYVLQNLVRAIQDLRIRSRGQPDAPEAGLVPPGFPDGGIGGCVPEYTNVYWNLAGLRAAVEAARFRRIVTVETTAWEAEYESFLDAFRRAARRDARKSEDGKIYLPILMKEDPAVHPVRGQWGFCHAVYPGRIFESDDPLALGTLALLDSRQSEGMVLGTGWMADGIWNYFASFHAHAHLWLGNGPKAARILYAFANHACPLLSWREEQHPSGKGEGLVGDMPHNWASAEFIRLVRNLLVLERGDELHLLEGLPRSWLSPGAETRLEGICTDFGPASLTLRVDAAGRQAKLALEAPVKRPPSKVVIHLGAWAAEGKPEVRKERDQLEVAIPLVP